MHRLADEEGQRGEEPDRPRGRHLLRQVDRLLPRRQGPRLRGANLRVDRLHGLLVRLADHVGHGQELRRVRALEPPLNDDVHVHIVEEDELVPPEAQRMDALMLVRGLREAFDHPARERQSLARRLLPLRDRGPRQGHVDLGEDGDVAPRHPDADRVDPDLPRGREWLLYVGADEVLCHKPETESILSGPAKGGRRTRLHRTYLAENSGTSRSSEFPLRRSTLSASSPTVRRSPRRTSS